MRKLKEKSKHRKTQKMLFSKINRNFQTDSSSFAKMYTHRQLIFQSLGFLCFLFFVVNAKHF